MLCWRFAFNQELNEHHTNTPQAIAPTKKKHQTHATTTNNEKRLLLRRHVTHETELSMCVFVAGALYLTNRTINQKQPNATNKQSHNVCMPVVGDVFF